MSVQISRSEFHEALKTVEPALGAGNQVIEQFAQLWFNNGSVLAYNDDIGMTAKCAGGIDGGVNGRSLLAVMQATSRSKNLTLECTPKFLNLTTTHTKVKLPIADPSLAVWTMPRATNKGGLEVNKLSLVNGIRHCLRSVGSNPSLPESLGITFEVVGERLALYSSNDKSICRVTMKLGRKPSFERVTIHKQFCEQFLILADRSKNKFTLDLTNDQVLMFTEQVELWGRILSTERPIDFEHLIAQHDGDGKHKAVMIPKHLKETLERSLIFCDDRFRVNVNMGKDRMLVQSQSVLGQMKDAVDLEGTHPTINVDIDPRDVRDGCDLKTLSVTDRAVIMRGERSLYVVSTLADAGVKRKGERQDEDETRGDD